MPPPLSKNAAITSAQASSNTGSVPTLNVIQLPKPTGGIFAPVVGIVRRVLSTIEALAGSAGEFPYPEEPPAVGSAQDAETPFKKRRIVCSAFSPFSLSWLSGPTDYLQ